MLFARICDPLNYYFRWGVICQSLKQFFCVKNVCMEPYKRSVIAGLSWILKLDGHKYLLLLRG
jgi:hypothetical protein